MYFRKQGISICQNPEGALKFLAWLWGSKENYLFCLYGEEDEDWKQDENGRLITMSEKTLPTLIQTSKTYESTQIDAFLESKPKIDAFLKIDADSGSGDSALSGSRFYPSRDPSGRIAPAAECPSRMPRNADTPQASYPYTAVAAQADSQSVFCQQRLLADGMSIHQHFSFCRTEAAGDDVHRGGFARPVRGKETLDHTIFNGKGQVRYGGVIAVQLRQMPDFNH